MDGMTDPWKWSQNILITPDGWLQEKVVKLAASILVDETWAKLKTQNKH